MLTFLSFQKKTSLFFAIITLSSLIHADLFAQEKNSIGLSGGITRMKKTGFGTMLTFSRIITENFYLTLSSGYISWNEDKNYVSPEHRLKVNEKIFDESITVPLQIGGRFYFGKKNFKPYIAAEMGYNFVEYFVYKNKNDAVNIPGAITIERTTTSDILASFGLGIGITHMIGNALKVDINATGHQGDSLGQYVRLMAGVNYLL